MTARIRTLRRRKGKKFKVSQDPAMSEGELAKLGGGKVAYLKKVSLDEARKIFPSVEGIPSDTVLFALHAADGTPLALTDTRQAALSHALDEDLTVQGPH